MRNRKVNWKYFVVLLGCLLLAACANPVTEGGIWGNGQQGNAGQGKQGTVTLGAIPEYDGEPYVAIEGNEPEFSEQELTEESFERYSELDSLGRCGAAVASVGQDLMPTEKRGSIGQVKPSGWQTVKYDSVDGKYLYNRCHLIGYQLSGENANEQNLITGTRYMNVDGMLPFENLVADYVKETGNHVMYRVTPVFEGDNLVASGVQMEAYSVEDQGEGSSYNVYVYNVQPGISIDYATGESALEESGGSGKEKVQKEEIQTESAQEREGQKGAAQNGEIQHDAAQEGEIRGNSRSKIYHCPGQAAYDEMEDSKNLVIFQTEEEAKAAGYRKAKR